MTRSAQPSDLKTVRNRRWLFATVIVSILFSVAVLEIFGRQVGIGPRRDDVRLNWSETGWSEENPVRGWSHRAGTFRSTDANNALMTFWPGGRRASWHNEWKSASKQVHVYGGSFTQGYSVPDEETFVFRLNAMFPDVRFENLGVGGYGGYQALLYMRQVEQQLDLNPKPDLIVYGFIGDHSRRNLATSSWINGLRTTKRGYVVPPRVRIDGDGLEEFAPDFENYWPLETQSVLLTLVHDAVLALKYDDWSGSSEEVNFRVISLMQDLADANGSEFLVVLLDDVPQELPDRLESADISFIDCVNPAFDQDPRFRVNGGTGHPSAAQNELWSVCIGRWLSENNFSPITASVGAH